MAIKEIDKILKEFFEQEVNKGFERRFLDSLHEDFNATITSFGKYAENHYKEKSNLIYRGADKDLKKHLAAWDIHAITPLIIKEICAVKINLLKQHTELLLTAAKTAHKESEERLH